MGVQMDSTTHMAGMFVSFGTRVIQRCAVCGEKLVDYTYPDTQPVFALGAYVHKDENGIWQVQFLAGENIPDSCLQLVE